MANHLKEGNMPKESDFQKKVIKWLRSKGCLVLKYEANATTRVGVADVFFCKEGFYGFLECKKAKNSPVRPGQKEFIDKVDNWSYGKIIFPENWPETRKELDQML